MSLSFCLPILRLWWISFAPWILKGPFVIDWFNFNAYILLYQKKKKNRMSIWFFPLFFFWFSSILWRVDDFVELWVFVNRIRIGGNFCIWNWSFWQCKHIFLWKMPKWPFFLFFVVMFSMCLDLVSFLSWQWLWDLKHICSFLSVHKEILLFSLIYISWCVWPNFYDSPSMAIKSASSKI